MHSYKWKDVFGTSDYQIKPRRGSIVYN